MNRRILAFVLCISMLLPLFDGAFPVAHAENGSFGYSQNIGRKARFDLLYTNFPIVSDPGEITADRVFHSDFQIDGSLIPADLVVVILDCFVNDGEGIYWYRIAAAEGHALPEAFPEEPWVFQNYTGSTGGESLIILEEEPEETEPVETEPVETEPEEACPICGQVRCAALHFYCDICKKHDCGLDHPYCGLCGIYDCTEVHIWCGSCGKFDCGLVHESIHPPVTRPVIPENPTLTPGAEVSVVDASGDPVTRAGMAVAEGTKVSLSAWPEADGEAAYQWQIRYDEANDLWADIRGQTGKGILVSPAMFVNILRQDGSAAVRCVVSSGGEIRSSEPIPLTIARQGGALSGSSDTESTEEEPGDDLQEVYLVVQYVYSDGRIAAATDIAEVIPGKEHRETYTVPAILGYEATVQDQDAHGSHVRLEGDRLTLDYADGELTEEYTVIVIVYQPAYVSYQVLHYLQNIENDEYTLAETETITDRHKTGEVIGDAHKDDPGHPDYLNYAGFYHLIYDTPAAAADGSTVIEIRYDRYYYLMKFNLGDMGYGVNPIYARAGAPIAISTPTRVGYTFLGWQLNGTGEIIPADRMPGIMPAENREYTAVWEMLDSAHVNVVFWGENPDDEGYTYIKTIPITAKTGERVSWDSYCFSCGNVAHTHNALCGYGCGREEHAHSIEDGCYVLRCTQESHSHNACTLDCEHTCDADCYTVSRGNLQSTSKPSQITGDTSRDGVYTYTSRGTTYYYLKIGNTWYRSSRGATNEISFDCSHEHGDACYTCGKQATSHTHSVDDGCYERECAKEAHTHDASCGYACGVAQEHVHSTACGTDQSGMDSSLYTLVRSETVTVEPDGSTVVNVYYDRKTFTLTFKDGSSTVYTITEKWGASIRHHWPIQGYDEGERWDPSGSDTYEEVLVHLDIMPAESFTLSMSSGSGKDDYVMHYMIEVLPGEDGEEYQSRRFVQAFEVEANYGYVTEAEDFFPLEGFTKWTSDPQFGSNGQINNGGGDVYFYYTRNGYAIEFYNPIDPIRTTPNIPYESNLGSYDFTPAAEEAPNLYEYGSVVFAGWYLNDKYTGQEYILSEHTMPAAAENGDTALVLYAKWEPIGHSVSYYLTRDSLERNEDIPTEMARRVEEAAANGVPRPETDPYTHTFEPITVLHGSYIQHPSDPEVGDGYEKIHPRTGYEFIGWFYLDAGEEKAFDPLNIPVTQDLKLYAKWSGNKPCKYNVYFALDADADGTADVDEAGNVIYVADPISGSALAGQTQTFTARGGKDLYDPEGEVNYREGYFPTTGSHSIVIDITDEAGTGANSFTFLYQPKQAVSYTVRYLEAGTEKVLLEEKVVSDNKNVVVTENFVRIQKYMPDEYQKTLVVTPDEESNVITFWYTKDEEHAWYVVNYYIELLDENRQHAGWSRRSDLQNQGIIGQIYEAEAVDIPGFTLSMDYTDGYNTREQINAMTGNSLPELPNGSQVSALTRTDDGYKLSGMLGEAGLELNFYYTRNLYPYEFRYMLQGTDTVLEEPETGLAGFDTVVTEACREIRKDLDGDGNLEDYRLYDPAQTHLSIRIKEESTDQATLNVATFYYVRSTQSMRITKHVADRGTDTHPEADREYSFSLTIHAGEGYHQSSYSYTKSGGEGSETGTLFPEITAQNTLRFSLRDGQSITVEGLPTAEYTLSELELPTGYYAAYSPEHRGDNGRYQLTVNGEVDVTVTNTYDPGSLEITKTVETVEEGNEPEVSRFEFTVAVPSGVTGTFGYRIGSQSHSATVSDGKMVIFLENGQTARFENLPPGTYAVTEKDYSASGYKSRYILNGAAASEGLRAEITVQRGNTQQVEFVNTFPVGDLVIEKTVTKAFYGTPWAGDTFTFAVERTTEGKPLKPGNTYAYAIDGVEQNTVCTVADDGTLTVVISFDGGDAALLETDGAAVTHRLTVIGLPAGTYRVTESGATADGQAAYTCTPADRTVDGLAVPGENVPVAEFANERIRPVGDLSLTKELIPEEGYPADHLPTDIAFTFVFELLEKPPTADMTFDVTYETPGEDADGNDAVQTAAGKVVMADGKFTLQIRRDQTVTVRDLPIGKYRITEITEPHYANEFAGINCTVRQGTSDDGRLYGDVAVTAEDQARVKCINTYGEDLADMTLVRSNAEAGQVFVYEIRENGSGMTLTVIIAGNGSVTVRDLPLGEYTVTQKNEWSWRYADAAQVAVDHTSNGSRVEFGAAAADNQWLSGNSSPVINRKGG